MKQYIKAGYVGRNGLSKITEKAACSLNVINIAFGHCINNEIHFDCGYSEEIQKIKNYNPEIKILLSVGGWGAGGFSPMAATNENRCKFAASAVRVLHNVGLDGIDIDWEYPCIDTAGIEATSDDKYNFTYMLATVRENLDHCATLSGKRPMLTIAAGAGDYYIKNTEIKKLAQIVDYISIMTYDMRGSWVKTTGHHTNLLKPVNYADDPESVEHSVEIFNRAGLPKEKLVIGAAFYSRKWDNVRNENNGYLQPSSGTGGYGPCYTDLYENYINKNGFIRYWDNTAKLRFCLTEVHSYLMMTFNP